MNIYILIYSYMYRDTQVRVFTHICTHVYTKIHKYTLVYASTYNMDIPLLIYTI